MAEPEPYFARALDWLERMALRLDAFLERLERRRKT